MKSEAFSVRERENRFALAVGPAAVEKVSACDGRTRSRRGYRRRRNVERSSLRMMITKRHWAAESQFFCGILQLTF